MTDENTGRTIHELKWVLYLPGPRHTDNCNINMTAFIFNLQIIHAKMVWMHYKKMSRKSWWRRNMDGMMTLCHMWRFCTASPMDPTPSPANDPAMVFSLFKAWTSGSTIFCDIWDAILTSLWCRLKIPSTMSDQVRHPRYREDGMG